MSLGFNGNWREPRFSALHRVLHDGYKPGQEIFKCRHDWWAGRKQERWSLASVATRREFLPATEEQFVALDKIWASKMDFPSPPKEEPGPVPTAPAVNKDAFNVRLQSGDGSYECLDGGGR